MMDGHGKACPQEKNILGFNPVLGVFYHWLGGLASASCYLPFRGIKRWSWETYWLVQGTFSWILAPTLIASLLVPHVSAILHAASASSVFYAYFWGCMWGVGGLTCGLSIRYLGFALGYPIVLGLVHGLWHADAADLQRNDGRDPPRKLRSCDSAGLGCVRCWHPLQRLCRPLQGKRADRERKTGDCSRSSITAKGLRLRSCRGS